MSADHQTERRANNGSRRAAEEGSLRSAPNPARQPPAPGAGVRQQPGGLDWSHGPHTALSDDTRLAVDIRGRVERGAMDEARERFEELVALHQRRASRIAYQYLRDASEADEAVQDAFVKAFSHISSYREAWPFEVWFTRILVNGCLDRRKARMRRDRWFVGGEVSRSDEARASAASAPANPEQQLLARERRARIAAAVDRLDGRQRTVFMLSQYGGRTPREISAITGL